MPCCHLLAVLGRSCFRLNPFTLKRAMPLTVWKSDWFFVIYHISVSNQPAMPISSTRPNGNTMPYTTNSYFVNFMLFSSSLINFLKNSLIFVLFKLALTPLCVSGLGRACARFHAPYIHGGRIKVFLTSPHSPPRLIASRMLSTYPSSFLAGSRIFLRCCHFPSSSDL